MKIAHYEPFVKSDKINIMLKWIEINEKALVHNLKLIRKLLKPKTKLLFTVKANAYGHGLKEIALICEKNNLVDVYGVHSIEEALTLREIGVKRDILILGYVEESELIYALEKNIKFTVYNLSMIKKLNSIAKKISKKAVIHLKVETGTGRQGILKKDWGKIRDFLKKAENIDFEGISSHFANIEDTTDHSYAEYQFKRFTDFTGIVKKDGFSPRIKHFSCSASTLLFPKTHLDMVRVGISGYGYWPSKETYLSFLLKNGKEIKLRKVLSFYSKISQIKTLDAGSFIGYGLTYKTNSKTKIAVLPVGYYDGVDRKLSNTGYFLVKGKRAAIRGRVCMNITVIDITTVKNVKLEDRVTLLGNQGDEHITADDWAEKTYTINYEILSRLSPLIKRVVNED
jgi:alanine racemase